MWERWSQAPPNEYMLPLPFWKIVCGDWAQLSYLSDAWCFEQCRETPNRWSNDIGNVHASALTFCSIINKWHIHVCQTRYTRITIIKIELPSDNDRTLALATLLVALHHTYSTHLRLLSFFYIHTIQVDGYYWKQRARLQPFSVSVNQIQSTYSERCHWVFRELLLLRFERIWSRPFKLCADLQILRHCTLTNILTIQHFRHHCARLRDVAEFEQAHSII